MKKEEPTKEEIERMNEETDKKMSELFLSSQPNKMKGVLIKKCPRCGMDDGIGIFISLDNPCYIACKLCSGVLTEIEIKDLSIFIK